MQWLLVRIFAGKVLRQRQCAVEEAKYVNVCGIVHGEEMYILGGCRQKVQTYLILIKIK